jgi:hypothetical protein
MPTLRTLALLIVVLAANACALAPEPTETPAAATFRRLQAIEYYDFRLGVSHSGGDAGLRVRDCSTDDYFCYAGLTVLIAPRRCSQMLQLIRSGAAWRVSDAVAARFVFRSENQLYYASADGERERSASGSAGFVYDLERGVVGVWRSESVLPERPSLPQRMMVIASTKWLESPASLFACGR